MCAATVLCSSAGWPTRSQGACEGRCSARFLAQASPRGLPFPAAPTAGCRGQTQRLFTSVWPAGAQFGGQVCVQTSVSTPLLRQTEARESCKLDSRCGHTACRPFPAAPAPAPPPPPALLRLSLQLSSGCWFRPAHSTRRCRCNIRIGSSSDLEEHEVRKS
eukprot:COSAG04_NODE_2276_length_4408_cov_12.871432_1_plen_161_part_00